jgi:hypothetical protein
MLEWNVDSKELWRGGVTPYRWKKLTYRVSKKNLLQQLSFGPVYSTKAYKIQKYNIGKNSDFCL